VLSLTGCALKAAALLSSSGSVRLRFRSVRHDSQPDWSFDDRLRIAVYTPLSFLPDECVNWSSH
jgi:hypothetical protein